MKTIKFLLFQITVVLGTSSIQAIELYQPADQKMRPNSDTTVVLPEKFLRGFDPVTAYFQNDMAKAAGPADNGARFLKIEPSWPGAYFWLDRRTIQFRPAEAWPALARFSITVDKQSRILSTMMSAPASMSPTSGSSNLKPFRTITLTFAQALPLESLKKMLGLEIRDLPGLSDSPRQVLHDFSIASLPRQNQREQVTYAITLERDVPEGKQLHVNLSLALGEEGKKLWNGRLSTRLPFQLTSIECGGAKLAMAGGSKARPEMALACGHNGETPQLQFSAPMAGLSLTSVKQLIRLEPSVPDLSFENFGARLVLRGKFVPDVLYRMELGSASILDDSGRQLQDPGKIEAFFYLGWKQPFLRLKQADVVIEAQGARMLPLVGYGEPRADVRIYRIDPLNYGLWPFPSQPVVINEEEPPPFPGEEPERKPNDPDEVDPAELANHIRLLGSPLISKVVDLPLADKGSTTHFGLEIGKQLDSVLGQGRPGHYLVGVRRLAGPPQRSYMRVQVSNLSLTAVEERELVVFFVRSLDKANPVSGATISLDVVREFPPPKKVGETQIPPRIETIKMTTDNEGRAILSRQSPWRDVRRVAVIKDEDVLVLKPSDPPPRFAENHWSVYGKWLQWVAEQQIPAPVNDKLLGFVFTERPIYRPGEKVYIKGFARHKVKGELGNPGSQSNFGLKVEGPGGEEWPLAPVFSKLMGFSAEFQQEDTPTGNFQVVLFSRDPYSVVAKRPFKVEAYRVPTFEVQLVAPDRVRNDGPFKIKALAKYYAGGSVAGQPVHWSIVRRPYEYFPKGREGFLFASSTQFSREGAARPPESMKEEHVLDDDGANEISINPGLDMDGSARIYHFEVTVVGVDNQEVNAVGDVMALPPFILGMKLPRYSEKPLVLKPEVLALGVDGKPIKGQSVAVRLYSRTWHSHLRETNFATGQADYVTEQLDTKILEKTINTGTEPIMPDLPIEKAGVYVVELFARDKLGRVQTLSADLYIGGKEAIAWKKSQQGVFALSPDKNEYAPGETARIIIQSPFNQGKALVIIEEPAGNTYSWKEIEGGKAVTEIKIRPQHVPNLPIHVVLMRGRLGEGKEGDDRYRPQTAAASLDLEVKPVQNRVVIEMNHPDTARPGSTINVELSLKNQENKPISGEVTLWLVDEAVLSLASEQSLDPLSQFIVRNRRTSSIRDTRNLIVGKIQEQQEDPGAGGGEDDGEESTRVRVVRKNFQTVPYYQATLEVGPSGKISVPIRLSDDLTNFMVRAVAVSGQERFGYKTKRLRVRLPLIIQPQLPRFVRIGDKFWAGGVGRLVEGEEGAGIVTIDVSGPIKSGSIRKETMLKRNKAESYLTLVDLSSMATTRPNELKIRMDITRKKDGAGDAFEVKLPLLPDRSLEQFAYFGKLRNGETSLQPFPEKPRAGSSMQEVLVSSVPGVMELLSGLDYLVLYPHGCLEQRMSQLMPQMVVGALLKKFGLNKHYALQVGAQANKLVAELNLYQDNLGFFGYWPGSKGDVALTAQALEFMSLTRRLGQSIGEANYVRAVEALKKSLRSDFPGFLADYRYNQQASAGRSLTLAGAMDEHYLIDLYQHREEMDLVSLADLSMAMSYKPDLFKNNLVKLREDLWERTVFKLHDGKPVFQGVKWWRPNWGYGYLGSNTSTLAAVLESLIILDPENPKLTQLKDALIAMASAQNGFGTTHDNRRSISALATYIDHARQETVRALVTFRGQSLTLNETNKIATAELQSSDVQKVQVMTTDELGIRVRYTYLPESPGDQTLAMGQGFIVTRKETILPADGSSPLNMEEAAGKVERLKTGDIMEVIVTLTSPEERYHVALVVPFAAGFEPLNPELKTAPPEAHPSQQDSLTASYVQRLDQEVRYYFTQLPKGSHSFYFRLRATCEGSYIHPAPYAEQMYHQEVRGRGVGMRFIVSGDHEK